MKTDPAQGKKARKPRSAAPKKVDPKIAAKEAAEKVDTTGMTAMQAWAAKQRAMKQAAAAAITKRITRKVCVADRHPHRCSALENVGPDSEQSILFACSDSKA